MTSVLGPDGKLASLRVDAAGRLLTTGGIDFRGLYANMPNANAVSVGYLAQLTDYNNTFWVSDGTFWRPASRQEIYSYQQLYPTPDANARWTGEFTGAWRTLIAVQANLPAKLAAPGTRITTTIAARKTGGTSTAQVSWHARNTQFTVNTDVTGTVRNDCGAAAAGSTMIYGQGEQIITGNNRLGMIRPAYQNPVNNSASNLATESATFTTTGGIFFVPGATVTGGSDTIDLVSFHIEVL